MKINRGFFQTNFYQHNLTKLGKTELEKIETTSHNIFHHHLLSEKDKNKKGLLIGKIQSGKTAQYINLISLAFDLDYDLAIVFSGIDATINQQTTRRLKANFHNLQNQDVISWVFNYDHHYLASLANIAYHLKKKKRKIIFSVMKNSRHLDNLIIFLKQLQAKVALKVIIIDDEGDLASLNNKKFLPNNPGSKIYQQIVKIMAILQNYSFFAVTATPYANLLLELKNWLSPDFLYFLQPSSNYFGLQKFIEDKRVLNIIEENFHGEINSLESKWTDDWPPIIFQKAFAYFLIAGTLAKKTTTSTLVSPPSYTMLIHSELKNSKQDALYQKLTSWIKLLKIIFADYFTNQDSSFAIKLKKFFQTGYYYLRAELQKKHPLNNDLLLTIKDNLTYETEVILKSSSSLGRKMKNGSLFPFTYRIVLGAKLVERGITFPNILTVFMTRRAKNIALFDTTLQRARWFGYLPYQQFLQVFLPTTIADDFHNLALSEQHLDHGLKLISAQGLPAHKWYLSIVNNHKRMEVTSKKRVKLQKTRVAFNNFQTYYSPLLNEEKKLFLFWEKISDWTNYDNVSHKELTTDDNLDLKKVFLDDQEQFARLLKIKFGWKEEFIDDVFEEIYQKKRQLKIVLINGWKKTRFRTCHHFHQKAYCLPSPVYTGVYQTKHQPGYKGDFWLYQYPKNKNKIILQVHKIMIKCQKKGQLDDCYFYALQLPESSFSSSETVTRVN